MNYLSHSFIKPESIERREYQLSIAASVLQENSMVVLPTGLGKTAIALIVTASRLLNAGGKIVMVAPTKPLVEQHYQFFSKYLRVNGAEETSSDQFTMFTGATPNKKRIQQWQNATCIFATPQVIKNDCLAGRYRLNDVSLLIVDECHRAVGNYAYVFIAEEYFRQADNPLLLAMTASPGSNLEKVQEICGNLMVSRVESRTDTDPDVKPYIHEREISYLSVPLPEKLENIIKTLNQLLASRLSMLSGLGFTVASPEKLSMKAMNAISAQVQARIKERDQSGFIGASIHAECMKLRHAISLAETQGSEPLRHYLFKLQAEAADPKASKASIRLSQDPEFQELAYQAQGWQEELLQKPEYIVKIVQKQIAEFPDSRIIVFATFRDTVNLIVKKLADAGIESHRFVGQSTRDTEKGLSQKEQLATLARFREGTFKVLVSTSVGEEGLDVPSTDLVIFYETVPSEIRSIQRKGRTGRHGAGNIIVLVTKGTADETYRWISQSREKSMLKGISSLKKVPYNSPSVPAEKKQQMSINDFSCEPEKKIREYDCEPEKKIIADDRETSSAVVEWLHKNDTIALEITRLEYGDYAIGNQMLVERKTARDFVDTLVERDLLGQIKRMADSCEHPVLIIEGTDIYAQRNIAPNAIRGALAVISVQFGVSVFMVTGPEETAEMLCVLMNRELGEPSGRPSMHHHKSYRSEREQLEYILSAFPGIGPRQARSLLEHFGSLSAVISASEEELRNVEGIGQKISGVIYTLSGKKY
ncbi:DEAD/DEAH box helicase [Methanogenium sp. MK-MG]|uniref:DEAD/DEAH box helicase n=1 Tax=Methanogenium sp. MK-MG TaxID=2599926 RepID=UPI0013EB89DD|nr:DEAD/DEAH box helicase [Methanogenium sp. MK-MG]KAF1075079.1 ATP-dependent RNA helicase SrmB [Methanogenium sp. MK-MG]